MTQALTLKIGWLYPTLMSTYGDRGNVIAIQQRAQWRGINVAVIPYDRDSPPDLIHEVDIIAGGGAQDRQQEIVMRDLAGAKAIAIKAKLDAGAPGVFTCGSPQLLGRFYEPGLGEKIEGMNIIDLETKHPGIDTQRCIGNVVFEITATRLAAELTQLLGGKKPIIVGFENHGGRTYLGPNAEALGKVIKGYGNNAEDGTEGAFYHNAIATYSHGPLIPKNPFIADWMIKTALQNKYQTEIDLTPLDDSLADRARAAMLKRWEIN
ncbi:type 1 glutamine amidotransferase [Chamaesiphon sp.]|uniref:type 1 glutamine amidotransferase n=1 Tax=Chamaesiphon sp. TaxID=2814140 RepID=UPI0035939ED4